MPYAFSQPHQTSIQTIEESKWLLFFTTIGLIFTGLGLRDAWPADEPRFALVAKEMVESGQWFFPARAQEFYPDKPPVFMWSIALFYWLTGSLKIAFLLPSALAGLMTIVLIYDIGKKLWDHQTGLFAGWLVLFSFQFMLQAKTAQIDAMVCAWITIGCYGLLRYCLVDGKFRWYALAWFFMGIGVITKGVGFLPLLMLIPYAVFRFKAQNEPSVVSNPRWTWAIGPLIMLLAISLWFVPMLVLVAQSGDPALVMYRDNILFHQTVTRYADSWHHIKPFWYYVVAVIPVFWLPVSLVTPWLIKPWWRACKAAEPRIILPLGWVFLVILFFSLSPGKRGVYIFPALPMFILAVAPFVSSLRNSKALKNIVFAISVLLASIFLLTGIAGIAGVPEVERLASKIEIEPWLFAISIGAISLVAILLFARQSKWFAWPVFFTALWMIYSTYGYQLRNEASTPHSVFREAKKVISDDAELAIIDFSEQFILYSPYPITHFGYLTDIAIQSRAAYQWLTRPGQYILVEDALIDRDCFDEQSGIDLGFAHRRRWVLLPYSAKLDSCATQTSNLPVYQYRYIE